jgi:hypothetical protein
MSAPLLPVHQEAWVLYCRRGEACIVVSRKAAVGYLVHSSWVTTDTVPTTSHHARQPRSEAALWRRFLVMFLKQS